MVILELNFRASRVLQRNQYSMVLTTDFLSDASSAHGSVTARGISRRHYSSFCDRKSGPNGGSVKMYDAHCTETITGAAHSMSIGWLVNQIAS